MTFMVVLVAFLAALGLTIKITKRKEEALLMHFYSMALKPINIRWFRTGFQQYLKIMYISNYKQFSTNIKIKFIRLIPISFNRAIGPTGLTKLVLILYFFVSVTAESCL